MKPIYTSILLFFFSLVLFCAPNKENVTEADLNRVLEKLAQTRVAEGITVKEGATLTSDLQIFKDSCKVFRLDPDQTLELLREKKPELHKLITRSE
ncbi:hypothetical protein [Leptospira sp. GIMC2001]|uniref:hypothetical protein n=1 Tax=Leptospira sp. GIMC2001 TaxID=1513297 RepID=UPI002349EEA8|nr:hypothetical protein [Leptospira sp. GIMC2001]WCL48178.1 hypothetical protein O4O04_12760 [Leptospira sp. GIMC2001]